MTYRLQLSLFVVVTFAVFSSAGAIIFSVSGLAGIGLFGVVCLSVLAAYRMSGRTRKTSDLRRAKPFLNALSLPVIVTNATGKVRFANVSAREFLGHTAETIAGLDLDKMIVPSPDNRQSSSFGPAPAGTIANKRVQLKTRSGQLRAAFAKSRRVRILGDDWIVVEFTEPAKNGSSDPKIAELDAELRLVRRELDQFADFAEQRLGASSHEMNIVSETPDGNKDYSDPNALSTLRQSVERIERIQNVLLNSTQMDRNRRPAGADWSDGYTRGTTQRAQSRSRL